MQCSKCGAQNSDGAMYCTNCGQVLAEPVDPDPQVPGQTVEPRNSRLAIASLVLGLLSLLCVTWPICGPLAIIFGIIALVKISNEKPYLKGSGMAVTGIVIPAIMILLIPVIAMLLAILMPALAKTKDIAQRVVCGTNLKGLGCAMTVYVNDYGNFPPENWCDLLIEEADVSQKTLICPQSSDSIGESSYAMNKNIAGISDEIVPAQMVLFFETDIGLEEGPRTESIYSRRYYKFLYGENQGPTMMVYEKRWNQYGGPDDLLLRHDERGQPGCNIAFADGHVEFVTKDRIGDLQWTAE